MTASSWKSYLLSAAASFLTVSLGLCAGLFSLAETFSLPVDAAALLRSCLLWGAASALVYAAKRPALRAALVVFLCGLFALYTWWQWESVSYGAQVLFYHISLGFHEEIPSILYYELPRELSLRYQRQAVQAFLTVAVPLLALWLGAWLTLTWPVWPAVASAAALTALPLFILRQPSPLVLAAFLLFLALAVLSRKGYRQSSAAGARRVLAGLLPTVLVMALLAPVLSTGDGLRPAWLEDLRVTLQDLPSSGFTVGVGGSQEAVPGEQSFQSVGPLRFTGRTVLQINSSSSQTPLFLRGFSAGAYTAEGWKSVDTASNPYPLGWKSSDSPFLFPYQTQPYVDTASVRITDMGTHTGYYYLPYYPSALPQDAVPVQDAYLERPEGTYEYHISFSPQSTLSGGGRLSPDSEASSSYYSEQEYRRWVYHNYLDVPYDLLTLEASAMLSEFSSAHPLSPQAGLAFSDSLYSSDLVDVYGGRFSSVTVQEVQALAAALRDYLASFTEYDQKTPLTPEGEDFVSWFLTQSHRGYCVHYASAAVLFLRACGLPARYAAGYAARPGRAHAVTNVPDRNAHAWVEVYLNSFGWYPVDVTPGFSGGGNLDDPNAADPTSEPSPSPSVQPPTPTPRPSSNSPLNSPSPSPKPLPASSKTHRTFLAVFQILLVISSLTALQYFLRRGHLRRKCSNVDPNQRVIALYGYLSSLARHGEISIPPEALELAQKARFSQHILTEKETEKMEKTVKTAVESLKNLPFFKRLSLRLLWALL